MRAQAEIAAELKKNLFFFFRAATRNLCKLSSSYTGIASSFSKRVCEGSASRPGL